jgi:hypothetical protein
MPRQKLGKKSLNLDVPADLHDMYSKLCIDLGITKTDGIVQYLRYLQKQHYKHRQVLNDTSPPDFKLDAGKH